MAELTGSIQLKESASGKDFVSHVTEDDRKIVLYGYGVIGKVSAPYFIEHTGLSEKVLFYVDADTEKQGTIIRIGERDIEVRSPELLSTLEEKIAILVTGSRFSGILDYLSGMKTKQDIPVFILPKMLADECFENDIYGIKKEKEQLIPKIIHYCWFGDKPIPEKLKKLMDSWKEYCPDYQIIRWSEKNYDLKKHAYTKEAYEHGKWAFIPDVARLEILYENGGIYLDTDVEIVKPLDDLLYCKGYVGVEKWGVINVGGGCGVIPHHPMIGHLLEERFKIPFVRPNGKLNLESSGAYETLPFIEKGYRPDNTVQNIEDMTIYSWDFFHPYDYLTKETHLTGNTYSVHRYSESWV